MSKRCLRIDGARSQGDGTDIASGSDDAKLSSKRFSREVAQERKCMSLMDYHIRKVRSKDGEPIVSIFNYFVENSYAAYPERKVGLKFFGKLRELSAGYPFYVVETVKEEVVGFGLMRAYHSCDTFKGAAEVTYFILPEHTRKGLGTMLLNAFTEEARKMGVDTLLVDISSRNVASLDFHRKSGFVKCGRLKRVGKKFGEDFDVVWMQKHIE